MTSRRVGRVWVLSRGSLFLDEHMSKIEYAGYVFRRFQTCVVFYNACNNSVGNSFSSLERLCLE